jgi:hypothetical protein
VTRVDERSSRWPSVAGLALALIVGAVLRLIWGTDIEYKDDERWTYERVSQARRLAQVPLLGMPSSQQVLNPGMSLWVFVALGRLAEVSDPAELARTVQVLNILALLALVVFAWRIVPAGEREAWLWAAALVAVNPVAVLFHRKIWPPSVLALFLVVYFAGWWRRERFGWALTWGLVGACLGQIHAAGFFLAAAFVLWAALFERGRPAWRGWVAGSCLGVVPLVPWLRYLLTAAPSLPANPGRWKHAFEGKFWVRWVSEPLGFGLNHPLGADYADFLSGPWLGGTPTWGHLLLHVVLGALGIAVLAPALVRWWRERRALDWAGKQDATAFTVQAALVGLGALITLSCFSLHRHYTLVLFPLPFVWLARIAVGRDGEERARRGRVLLAVLVVVQALLTFQFLGYVHQRDEIHGDFGRPYGRSGAVVPVRGGAVSSARDAGCGGG